MRIGGRGRQGAILGRLTMAIIPDRVTFEKTQKEAAAQISGGMSSEGARAKTLRLDCHVFEEDQGDQCP